MSGVQELSRPTVLVADDSPQNIELLSRPQTGLFGRAA
jgi:CheY-like chemotaxis protein